MSNITQGSFEPSGTVVRQYAAKLANEVVIVPAMKTLTDTAPPDNTLNVLNDAGFLVPDAAPTVALNGAGAMTGTYAYYVTFYDEDSDTEGNPSAISSSLSPSSQQIRLTFADTNSGTNTRVTHRRVYRNTDGGSTYYLIATVAVATGTYDDNATDAAISANDTLDEDNDAPATSTYGHVITHKNFMFMFGPSNQIGGTAYDHDVTWSKVQNPDAWPTINRTKFERGLYGIVRAMHSVGDALLLYKDRCIIRWTYDEDPSGIYGDGNAETVNTEYGALNQRCVVNFQGTHFVMDRNSIYATRDGSTVNELHHDLDRYWKRINWAARHTFCGVWGSDRVWFFVALDEDTTPHHAFVLDLLAFKSRQGQRWYVEKYDFGIRDAERIDCGNTDDAVEYNMVRRIQPCVIDDQGQVWMLGIGYRDGVYPRLSATGTVASSGSSTTVVEAASGGTWEATNEQTKTVDVRQCYLRWADPEAVAESVNMPNSADWRRAYRITSISSDSLTVTPAMPVAPPAGATFWIGAIPDAVLKTPQMSFGQPHMKKRAGHIVIEHMPGGVAFTGKVRVSNDRLGVWDHVSTSASDQSMWTTTDGKPDLTVKVGGDFDENGRRGITVLPLGNRWFRYLQVEFDASGPDKPWRIDGWDIELREVADGTT